jgi:Mg-chelatase subunit ChlD
MHHIEHRLSTSFILVLVAGLATFGQSGRVQPTPTPTPRDDETVKISVEEIKLNVLAFDDSGMFFRGVTENDLVIVENDRLHQPTSVRRIPANVLIIMDTGGEMRFIKSLDRTRRVAAALIASLADGDSIAVMQYADKPEMLTEWTSNKGEARAAIARSNFGRKSAFVDSIKLAIEVMQRSGAENRHIVLITDGTDSETRSSDKVDALRRLTATDISVHVFSYTAMESADIEPRTRGVSKTPPPKAMPDEIADTLPNGTRDAAKAPRIVTINTDRTFIRRVKARKADLDASQEQLAKLAENTNGEFVLPGTVDEMIEKADRVARMIDSVYVVTYMPREEVVGTRGIAERKIEVVSKRPGLTVQARRKLLLPQ